MEDYKKRIKRTKQGYKYIEVTPSEVLRWGGICVCDTCGEMVALENSYLVYILASCICKKCFNDWKKRAIRYEENIKIQKENSDIWFKYYLDRGGNYGRN